MSAKEYKFKLKNKLKIKLNFLAIDKIVSIFAAIERIIMETKDFLMEAFEEAVKEIEPTIGIWTMGGCTAVSIPIGKVVLKSGRVAIVELSLNTDLEEVGMSDERVDSLTTFQAPCPTK